MSRLLSFVRLDFITVKPFITGKNLLIYAAIAVSLTAMSKNVASVMGIFIAISILYASYPFALGEKSNMDALYATLSIDRKTVVLGRYLFAFTLNLCTALFAVAAGAVGNILAGGSGTGMKAGEILLTAAVLSAVFIVMEATQLPLFFKMGYSKAKIVSMIPLVVLVSGFAAFSMMAKDNETISQLIVRIKSVLERLSLGGTIALGVLVLLIVYYVSYRLSLMFYKKREF